MNFKLKEPTKATCAGLPRYRTRALTGYAKPNCEGFKPSHVWHPIYRKKGESGEALWKRMEPHLLPVEGLPRYVNGVHVIAAVEGFLVTLDPRGVWPVLHPYPHAPNGACAEENTRPICPDCERPMKVKKSWGGEYACYCLWGGRCPSDKQLMDMVDDPGLYERRRAIIRHELGLPEVPAAAARFTTPPPPLRYTAEESAAANDGWKATCGPHSIAAALRITLDQVRAALEGYRGWMSPTQVTAALHRLEQPFRLEANLKTMDLCDGINRIQWEGPWLDPGKPARIAYFHTHYVAHFGGMVLCTACLPAEWIPVEGWRKHHLEVDPPSPFHVTHHWIL